MGGCASKPKVVKGDAAVEAPAPAPEKVVAAVKEAVEEMKKVVEGGGEDFREKEVVEAEEPAENRRSLSLLFKEKEGKELTEAKVPSEPIKTEKAAEEGPDEPKLADAEKLESQVKEAPAAVVVETPVAEAVKPETFKEDTLKEAPISEPRNAETPEAETSVKESLETPKPETSVKENLKAETPDEETPKDESPKPQTSGEERKSKEEKEMTEKGGKPKEEKEQTAEGVKA